ncbi:MAG: hypothetical protein KDI71_17475 [Xanthomonadales bacterium]|nr:hypothetical protein [Xanthomonadales bacterium]
MNTSVASEKLDLGSLDLSVLDQLADVQGQLSQIDTRLKAMDEKRSAVAEQVFNRVRKDYMEQRQELMAKATPLKESARELYNQVRSAMTELEQAFEAARMDQEEIEFRHSLGEFDDAELKRRLQGIKGSLAERAKAKEQVSEIRDRFNKAFKSMEELDEAPPPARPADESEEPTQRVNQVKEDDVTTAEMENPDPEPPPAPVARPTPPPPRRNPDATVVFRPGRLIDQATDNPGGPYTLGLRPLSIGSDSGSDVKVDGVAGRQAEVGPSRSGFILRDLAGKVTKVNGQPVDELLLKDGDLIEVGSVSLKFSQV